MITLCALALAAQTPAPAAPAASLRRELIAVAEVTFSGDYARSEQRLHELQQRYPRHPAPDFYLATVQFWRNNPDPSNPARDGKIRVLLKSCLAKAATQMQAQPEAIDPLHYRGLCFTYLGRLKAHRGHLYDGGQDGETGRDLLEQALTKCATQASAQREPACEDLYFPLGAYGYYAGRLPSFLQMMNFLWFIPRGSTEEGLAALRRAEHKSELHHLGAQSLLVSIYSLFEPGQQEHAVALSTRLIRRFANNPYLDLEHARVLHRAGHFAQSLDWAGRVRRKAHKGLRNYTQAVEMGARLTRCEALLALGRLNEAEVELRAMATNSRLQVYTDTPLIYLNLGRLADLRGQRDRARAQYEKVKGMKGRVWNRQAIKAAKRYLDKPFVSFVSAP